jgi:hypothetical protein
MHPKISPALPALLEEGLDGRRSRLGTRRLTAEQRPRRRRAARPNHAVADESRQSPLMLGVKAGSHGFEARDRASSVDDQDRRDEAIFRCYEEHNGRITAYFEDGTSVEGDVLVAADGGGSRVRRQFLPDAQRVETGVVGIAGKMRQTVTDGLPALMLSRLTMRTISLLPPVKQIVARRLGEE